MKIDCCYNCHCSWYPYESEHCVDLFTHYIRSGEYRGEHCILLNADSKMAEVALANFATLKVPVGALRRRT